MSGSQPEPSDRMDLAPLRAISVFSGAMGLDLGLEHAGVDLRVTVDSDPAATNTVRANRPELCVMNADVSSLSGDVLLKAARLQEGEVDLVVGGPPCQAFSVYGRRRGISDPRGALVFQFVRLVGELRPRYFAMENVRGLLSMTAPGDPTKGALLRMLVSDFNAIGYRVDLFVVNAVNYGAPQLRERLILLGSNSGLVARFPAPTHSNRPQDDLRPFATLGDALHDFQEDEHQIMDFSPRKKSYLALVPPGGNWRMLPIDVQKESMGKAWHLKGGRSAYWRKLSFEFPCPTIVTMPNHAGTSMCHPTELRPLSVGECARVQGFPDDWRFVGTTADAYRLIGNAVPVRLGEVVGEALRDLQARAIRGERDDEAAYLPYREVHLRPHVRTRYWYKNGKALAPVSYYAEAEGSLVQQPLAFG